MPPIQSKFWLRPARELFIPTTSTHAWSHRLSTQGDGADTSTEGEDAISLSPDLVASTALSSLNIHSGILLLEASIMRTARERAAATDTSKTTSGAAGVGGVQQQQRRRRGLKGAAETHGKTNVVVDLEKGQQVDSEILSCTSS